MSDLFGAWSLTGKPIDRLLSKPDRDLILGSLCAAAPARAEFHDGPLWVVADPARLRREERRCTAYSGYIASDSRETAAAPRFLNDPSPEELAGWDGHFAWIQGDAASLWLFRDLLGGERLFYARLGDLVFFANSLKPLLAHPRLPKTLDEELAAEFVISGDASVVFGDRTLWRGVAEVLPGQMVVFSKAGMRALRCANPLLTEPRESADHTPQRLRRHLIEAVESAIGPDKQAAVLLSGGLDSSALAAFAVDALGPKNVHAFTYEFEEPTHPTETQYATLVARHLGISHHVVRISYDDYLASIPELLWRLETPRPRSGAWLLTIREIGRRGFRKALTGMGLEHFLGMHQHDEFMMTRLEGLSRASDLDSVLTACMDRRFAPAQAAPAEPPSIPPELYYLLLCLWKQNGRIEDVSRYYPRDLGSLVRMTAESGRVRQAVEPLRHLSFPRQVRHAVFDYYTGHRAVRGKMKAWNELGVQVLAPALFAGCIAQTPDFAWHTFRPARTYGQTKLMDFRWLLNEAVGDRLPSSIVFRRKIVEQSPVPRDWPGRLLQSLKPVLLEKSSRLSPIFEDGGDSLKRHYSDALVQLGLFHRLFLELPLKQRPPLWEEMTDRPFSPIGLSSG